MTRFFLQFFAAISLPVLAGLLLPDLENGSGGYHTKSDSFTEPRNIPGAFTGGFGEETCHSCHFDYDINHEGGRLDVDGLPEAYSPGEQFEIRITVESERLQRGGFQMTARLEDGSQAGLFEWPVEDDRLAFTANTGKPVQYIQHSEQGTNPTSELEVSWTFQWISPSEPAGPVIFNIAANAGNDDLSPFGDWIYVQEFVVDSEQ